LRSASLFKILSADEMAPLGRGHLGRCPMAIDAADRRRDTPAMRRRRSDHRASLTAGYAILSFVLVVALPTAIWTGLIFLIASVTGGTLTARGLQLIALAIGLFLGLIWAMLLSGRTPPSAD
jgi:hypothetical protein